MKKYYKDKNGKINKTEGTPIEEKILHDINELREFLSIDIYTISYWSSIAKVVRVDRKTVNLPINTVELCDIIVA